MLRSAIFSAIALSGLVAAQSNLTINVGLSSGSDIFVFTPSTVNASVGQTVTFVFSGAPGNHSVTQSAFTSPCQPESGGFDSGWVQIPTGFTGDAPTWNLTITNDSVPLWFFCKQLLPSPHCSAGMVGGINVPTTGDHTFQAFQQAAEGVKGASGQGEGQLIGQGASASAPPGPLTASGVSGFANPTPGQNSSASATSGSSGSSSSSSGSAAPSATGSGAGRIEIGAFSLFVAGLFGIALA